MDIFKSPMDQLAELLPDTQDNATDHSDNTDWLGWDGWVDVGSHQAATTE